MGVEDAVTGRQYVMGLMNLMGQPGNCPRSVDSNLGGPVRLAHSGGVDSSTPAFSVTVSLAVG